MIPNKSVACIFPDTLPDERFLRPLVQVFDKVVYLQAIENEAPLAKSTSRQIGRYHNEGRIECFTPVPLGEQRQRFIALSHDLQKRGSHYINQLGMLTLAELNRTGRPESRRTIISDILNSSGIRPEQLAEQLLWQSRLVLQLAEMYDREQAGLRQALQDITEQEQRLLATLCDERDSLFTLPAESMTMEQETDSLLQYRLRAWTRLVFHTDARSVIPGLLITRYQAALDLVHEFYEKQRGQSPRLLTTLEIPVTENATGPESTMKTSLYTRCPDLSTALSTLHTSQQKGVRLDEGLGRLLEKGTAEWLHTIASSAGLNHDLQWKLELYLFEDISPSSLFTESYVAGKEYSRPTQPETGCVVGLLAAQ